MTQFCARLLGYYALLAPQRGGIAQCPLNTPLPVTYARFFKERGFKSDIKTLVAIYTLANK